MDNYVSTEIAADLVGYSQRQIQRLAQGGKIKSRRTNKRVSVDMSSLERYAEERAKPGITALVVRWLQRLPPRKRDRLTYNDLAVLARRNLNCKQIHETTIYRAWRHAGLPKRGRAKTRRR